MLVNASVVILVREKASVVFVFGIIETVWNYQHAIFRHPRKKPMTGVLRISYESKNKQLKFFL
jgi:hypothetical protein